MEDIIQEAPKRKRGRPFGSKGKKVEKLGRGCKICLTPYRKELEDRITKGESIYAVAKSYCKAFNLTFQTTYQSLATHMKHHLDRAMLPGNEEAPIVSFELASKILLQEGMKDRGELSVRDKLQLAQAIEKVNIGKQQARTQEDALKLAAAKFFGGFIQGEEIDGDREHNKLTDTISTDTE